MAPLFAKGAYEIVQSADAADRLALLRRGHNVCDISGQCAEKLRWLFAQLQQPAFAAKFPALTNCHGLAEFLQGRALKWRNKPKYPGTEHIAPNAPLPEDLPLTYQWLNWERKAVHSGVVLGRRGNEGDAFILDKLQEGSLNIETYRESIQAWTRLVCPLSSVGLRHAAQPESVRKAA